MERDYTKLSSTRGARLEEVAGLCFVIGSGKFVAIKDIINRAIDLGIIDAEPIQSGQRLPTRINHSVISLKDLELIHSHNDSGSLYELSEIGIEVFKVVEKLIKDADYISLTFELKEVLRNVMISSHYVRYHWLKYFMSTDIFSLDHFITNAKEVSIYKIPAHEKEFDNDSRYRIASEHWQEIQLDEVEKKEIYDGLRRWTNSVYLTDDRLTDDDSVAYQHQTEDWTDFEIISYVVKQWLDPQSDLDKFELMLVDLFNLFQVNRIPIPEIIQEISITYNISKFNIKDMLKELYYQKGDSFFFERGSEFLIKNAFSYRPEDFYVKIEGIWRVGLVRY